MSRNVMLLGGPDNGRLARVDDNETVVSVVVMEKELVQTLSGWQPLGDVRIQDHLYWQSDHDKNVFNYAH